MKSKQKIKVGIDILMTVLLLGLMAYHLTGQLMHEWMGVSLFALITIHLILNDGWLRRLHKGEYTPLRIFQTVKNGLIALTFLGLMVSGIMMSRYVFGFLRVSGGVAIARTLHHVSTYWFFVLISMHLGFHWSMIMGILRKVFAKGKPSRTRTVILRIIALLIAAFGIYAFMEHQMGAYMLNQIQFSFFDYDQSPFLFFLEYIAVKGLFTAAGHYLSLALKRKRRESTHEEG